MIERKKKTVIALFMFVCTASVLVAQDTMDNQDKSVIQAAELPDNLLSDDAGLSLFSLYPDLTPDFKIPAGFDPENNGSPFFNPVKFSDIDFKLLVVLSSKLVDYKMLFDFPSERELYK